MSQMSLFDYINGITIGSIAAEMATDLENYHLPLTAMIVYGLAAVCLSWISQKSMSARRFLNGKPLILLHHDTLYEENLKKQLRQHIQSGKAASRKRKYIEFSAPEALFDYVKKSHQDYLLGQNTVEGDISHIIPMNSQVLKSITHFGKRA